MSNCEHSIESTFSTMQRARHSRHWTCWRCGHSTMPIVAGGQGRSDEDAEGSAAILAWTFRAAVVLAGILTALVYWSRP